MSDVLGADVVKSSAPQWFDDALHAPFHKGTVEVQGCPIQYLSWGTSGRPGLLLVHGGGAHTHWWSFLAPLLAADYQVVAFDLSGHGESGWREQYSGELWAREALSVAADAGLVGKPVFIGHSMGGQIGILAAGLFPRAFAGLVLADAPVRRNRPQVATDVAKTTRKRPPNPLAMPFVYSDRERAVRRFRLMPPQACENTFILEYIARHSLRAVEKGWTWKYDPRAYRSDVLNVDEELLESVTCRVALLRGELSVVLTPKMRDQIEKRLKGNISIVEIPDAGHHLLLDQPLAFVTGVRAVLSGWGLR